MAHGRTVVHIDGYQAFVPDPLPPPINWNEDLVVALSGADRSIGRLAGEGAKWQYSNLIIPSLIRAEAVSSSRIEGTGTSLSELLEIETRLHLDEPTSDYSEVARYVAALEFGLEQLHTLPVSLRLVRQLHDKLMLPNNHGAGRSGQLRKVQNWIGSPGRGIHQASYIPPPPGELDRCLDQWEKSVHTDRFPPLILICLAHAQFEAIHPFVDGNGRVGRLLITLMLIERDVLPAPLLDLSTYFERTRDEYIDRLNAISSSGRWEEWLLYFLRAVQIQSEQAVSRIRSMNQLFENWRCQVADNRAPTVEKALMLFAESPFWTIAAAAAQLRVSFSTARRAFIRLLDYGIITQIGKGSRDRTFCARSALELLIKPVAHSPRGGARRLI